MDAPLMIRDVSNVLSILEATRGGRVACEMAEELLLVSVAMIWRTAGAARACATMRELTEELARPTGSSRIWASSQFRKRLPSTRQFRIHLGNPGSQSLGQPDEF
jgi:hypothetical protein